MGKNLGELKKEEGRQERALKEAEEAFRREKEEEVRDKKRLVEELGRLRSMQEAEGRDESDGDVELMEGGEESEESEGEGEDFAVLREGGGNDRRHVVDSSVGGIEQVNGKEFLFLMRKLAAENGEKDAVEKIARLIKMRLRVFGKHHSEVEGYLYGPVSMETGQATLETVSGHL